MSKTAFKNFVIFFACFLIAFLAGVSFGFCFKKEKIRFVEVEKTKYEVIYLEDDCLEQQENTKTVEMVATAYCSCEKCCGVWATKRQVDENGNQIVYTASGTVAKQGRTVAVDPSVYPYGTKFLIDGQTYVAEDCGGAIKGNRIDVYFENHKEALIFGKKTVFATVEMEK